MLSCLVVDDEPSAINVLKTFIEKTPFLTFAGSANDPLEAMQFLQNNSVDLLFLDIQMPHLSGIDFLKMIKGKYMVILTTAYTEFAVESFEHEALDYLLKPIPFERFLKATQKALNQSLSGTVEPVPAHLPEKEDDYIFVKTETKGKILKVNLKDILYVEGLKNYVSIYTTDEQRIITYISIKELESKLPPNFMRVHKSYIISLEKIKGVDGNQIQLNNMNAYIPLGETYRKFFFDKLQDKIMGGKI